jgi:hypothetical protein
MPNASAHIQLGIILAVHKNFQPQGCKSARTGFSPKTISCGVVSPIARVQVRFFKYTACMSASPHRNLGRPLS